MVSLSQNKKIAISALALFLISFVLMLIFLENKHFGTDPNQANVFNIGSHHSPKTEPGIDELYKAYLTDRDAPFFVSNPEGKIKYANEGFCNLLSVEFDKFKGSLFFDYINNKDLSEFFPKYTKIIQNGESIEGLGPYRMLKNDREIMVLLSAYPVMENDKITEIVFSLKDLTERIEEFNDYGKENNEEEEEEKHWIRNLYPKIKDVKNDDIRMVVDRITYNKK